MERPRSARRRNCGTRTAVAVVAMAIAGLSVSPPVGASAHPAVVDGPVSRASADQRDSVLRLYRAYFLRAPDQAGLAYWTQQYVSGRSLASISDFFARSDEFRKRYGSLSDAEFVRLVYSNVLSRLPDAEGQRHWTSVLRSGASRGAIMVGFSESPEFQRITGTLPPEPTRPPTPQPEGWAAELLSKINAERARVGLPPLSACGTLTRAATAHSADQARRNQYGHVGSNGSQFHERIRQAGYGGSAWGENVAGGQGTAAEVVAAWMASATHRDNLLSRTYQHIGLGRVASSNGTLYWTLDFGAGGTC